MWRVRGVLVQASGAISGRIQDQDGSNLHSDSYQNAIARTYYCQKPPINAMTEADQLLGRGGYSNAGFNGGISESITEPFGSDTITAFQFSCDWGNNAFHIDGFPEEEAWVMNFSTGITLNIPNPEVPVGAIFTSSPTTEDAGFPGSIVIKGFDPVSGEVYFHSVPHFWLATRFDGPGTSGVTSASAEVIIEAVSFYDWSNLYATDGTLL
jgi:hypothetical protein